MALPLPRQPGCVAIRPPRRPPLLLQVFEKVEDYNPKSGSKIRELQEEQDAVWRKMS